MWPNGRRASVNATELIWEFFQEQARQPGQQQKQKKPVVR